MAYFIRYFLIDTFKCFAEDMAKFVDNYPEYRKMHGNVSKHVTLVSEMSKIVEERKLMLVSQTEQELACNGGLGAAFEVVKQFISFHFSLFLLKFLSKFHCCWKRSHTKVNESLCFYSGSNDKIYV